MQKYIAFFKRQKLWMKLLLIFILLFIIVISYTTLAWCSGSLIRTLTRGDKNVFYYAFKDKSGKPITTMLYVLATFIIFYTAIFMFRHNNVSDRDNRGVNFMEQSTYGSSRWMRENEVYKAFEVNRIIDTTTTIYGQLSEGGRKVVGYKKPESGGTGNRNVICVASMGAGKSFGYVRTELIQAVLRGDSFVVTDPSAELYTDLAKFCIDRNLEVKVLNLAEPDYSEYWNCLEETIDPDTERLDPTRLNDFAAIYMQNSGNGDDDFWYNSALNLLKAVIAYTAYKREEAVLNNYKALYLAITGEVSGEFYRAIKQEMVSLKLCRKRILDAAREHKVEEKKVTDALEAIDVHSSKYGYTMSQVFYNLLHFREVETNIKDIPNWHPAHINYLVYTTNDTESVRKSALQGIQLRFQLFSDGKIKEILSYDGIHLSDVNQKQSAYFVIMSDKSTTTKPIASLFFSFLFKDAQDIFDKKAQIAKSRGIPNPCLNLVTMLDEFYSIGVIGGSPEAFGVTMSNSRKRNIFISVIIQAYSQLEAVYGPQVKDIIQGGCSTLLYLGGNDPETCKFISEFASGESTVLSEMHDEFGLLHKNDLKLKVRTDKRFLLTVDEARRWKNAVLVVKQGEYPLKLNPFPWIEHPCFINKDTVPTSVYEQIVCLETRAEIKKKLNSFDKSIYIKNKINACYSEPVTNEGVITEKDIPKEESIAEEKVVKEVKEEKPQEKQTVKEVESSRPQQKPKHELKKQNKKSTRKKTLMS